MGTSQTSTIESCVLQFKTVRMSEVMMVDIIKLLNNSVMRMEMFIHFVLEKNTGSLEE